MSIYEKVSRTMVIGKTERLAKMPLIQFPNVFDPGMALASRTIGAVIRAMITLKNAVSNFQRRRRYEMAIAMTMISMMMSPMPERAPITLRAHRK
ncbi:MAG: hypothetical protein UW23_C0029G0014 [Candidatus Collierbacteria bacterium GW2011_GWA1_44_12]|uniref:Uncharacterized protein n=1 Tax=Candidatus Collierbacteria bacterium GW2011_GWA1_44_12 TaxID=1618376 RepID=A0A0G1GII3_9BACT|nr:MAG: hypothetical protein UW23_C0029G0014 [Candidatus Collierbacteria bacterium GW2011_GWA1_44_12]